MELDRTAHFTNLYTLVGCLTKAIDLVSPVMSGHHQQVAYLSHKIADAMNLSFTEDRSLVVAALIHDVGAIDSDESEPFEPEERDNNKDGHAKLGADLLAGLPLLSKVSEIIRYHHQPWLTSEQVHPQKEEIPLGTRIIHVADKVAVRLDKRANVISQIGDIKRYVSDRRGGEFDPKVVGAFLTISNKESLWLDTVYNPQLQLRTHSAAFDSVELSLDDTVALTGIFAKVIDFRSPFTAMHSAGVAAAAVRLAELIHMSDLECQMMDIAGNLHDIGKLAVPRKVLEKQDRLTPAEFDIIRAHSYYTYQLLDGLEGFSEIQCWAAYHHERLDGKGYPFKLKANNLSTGSRLMAVADIFAAITEDRPYREGMSKQKTIAVLSDMVQNGGISPYICSVLIDNYDDVAHARKTASERAVANFEAWHS